MKVRNDTRETRKNEHKHAALTKNRYNVAILRVLSTPKNDLINNAKPIAGQTLARDRRHRRLQASGGRSSMTISYRSRREDDLMKRARKLENETDELEREFDKSDRWIENKSQVRKILNIASDINRTVKNRRLGKKTESNSRMTSLAVPPRGLVGPSAACHAARYSSIGWTPSGS